MKNMRLVPGTKQWKSINWNLIQHKVKLLQARIVKARKQGKHRKVKALQWLLVHSFYAKLLAIKRVTQNKGKNTPGVDGCVWNSNTDKIKAVKLLTLRGYKAAPLRRVLIPKANGKKRPLGIPTMKDRAMQALFLMALNPIAETTADLNSYGFRPKRCCADAIEQCFIVFAGRLAPQWILEADIKSCFDHISHEWLMEYIPMNRSILKQWLKAGFVDKGRWFQTNEGTPQGGIISPTLANITLDGLEQCVYQACGAKRFNSGQKNKAGRMLKINFIRYADDFIVAAANKNVLQNQVLPAINNFLQQRGLQINQRKTKITHIQQGFDFLGQNVRKYKNKLLIKPSRKSCTRFIRNVHRFLKKSGALKPGVMLYQLNAIIRGWGNYHRFSVAKHVFSKLDNAIFHALWRWAKNRHQNKGHKWIKNNYFKAIDSKNWVFQASLGKKVIELFKLESIPIKRFVKVKFGANPFDSEWFEYFEKRKSNRVK